MREVLFQRFPIETGIKRKIVKEYSELENYVLNETNDVFASVYSRRKKEFYIDKIFFDFDSNTIPVAYDELLQLKERLEEYGTTIHVWTGKRGFHLYLLLNAEWISEFNAKKMLETIFDVFTEGLRCVDHRCTADVNRLTRVPNTSRESGICTMLPQHLPRWFYQLEEKVKLNKFNSYNYEIKRTHSLFDIYELSKDKVRKEIYNDVELLEVSIDLKEEETDVSVFILKQMLRPCIFASIYDSEAPHEARTAAAIDLLRTGMSVTASAEMLERMNWSDFNFKFTVYHLSKLRKEKLKPYSCAKMRKLGYCTGKDDCWYMRALQGDISVF